MPEPATAVAEVPVDQATGGSQEVVSDQANATPDSAVDISKIDPSTLTPELQAVHKSLLADYTKKTQELSGFKSKAESFDSLMGNEGFAQMIKNLEEFGTPYPPQKTDEAGQAPLSGEELLTKILEDPHHLTQLIRDEAKKLVEPLTERAAGQDAEQKLAQLTEKYPDFMQFEEDVNKKIVDSGYKMDPEDAYKAVTFDKVRAAAKQEGVNEGANAVQQRVNSATTTGSSAAATQTEIKGWADAFNAAKKKHGLT